MTPPAQASAPLLHRFLGIGLVILLVTAGVMKLAGMAPMLPPGEASALIAYAFAGIAAVLIVIALLVLKPRATERQPGQSIDAYWSSQAVVVKIMPVWFLLEGAGVLSVVGFFMTGLPVSALAAAITVGVFWWCGPAAFAKP